MTEIDLNSNLIEGKQKRKRYAKQVHVLNIIKPLKFIPGTKEATTQQIAEYYETSVEIVKHICSNHRHALRDAGAYIKSHKEFYDTPYISITKKNYANIFVYQNGEAISVSHNGMYVYTPEAILLIGMLIKDSEIAYKVREKLLTSNHENTNVLKDLTELKYDLCKVIIDEDNPEILSKILDYSKRYDVPAPGRKYLSDDDRKSFAGAILKMHVLTGKEVLDLYDELSEELIERYDIRAKERGDKMYLRYIYEDERLKVLNILLQIAKKYNIVLHTLLDNNETRLALVVEKGDAILRA